MLNIKPEFALLTTVGALAMFGALIPFLELGRRVEVYHTRKSGRKRADGLTSWTVPSTDCWNCFAIRGGARDGAMSISNIGGFTRAGRTT